MAVLETSYSWDFAATASTGALKAFPTKGYAERFSFYVETGAGCTATVRWETRAGSSAGPYATIASTALSTSAVWFVQNNGPLEWIRPYCVAKTTGTLTARVIGN